MTEDSLSFSNDGQTLARLKDSPESSTLDALMEIDSGHKEADPESSGHFGSGFRSTHLFSDEAHINGMVIVDGSEKRLSTVCKSYTTETYSDPKMWTELEVRDDSERPNRSLSAGPATERKGVQFSFQWRKKARNDKWEGMKWSKEDILALADDYARELPRILLGCRWIREAVLIVDVKGNKSSHMWVRDFNIEEMLEGGTRTVNVDYLSSKKAVKKNADLKFSKDDLKKVSSREYSILAFTPNARYVRIANKADYKPTCFLIIPTEPGDELLPAYTPIALTGDSGNAFGALAFLPPHESRTKIKLEGALKPSQVEWAISALEIFSSILPTAFDYCLEMVDSESMDVYDALRLIPKARPDSWFSDSSQAHRSNRLQREWARFTSKVSEAEIIPSEDGLVAPEEATLIEDFDEEEAGLLSKVLRALGISVMDDDTITILETLDWDHWSEDHPLAMAQSVSSALELSRAIQNSDKEPTIDLLGEQTTRELLRLVVTNPSDNWSGSEDRWSIPAIPDADGVLRPMHEKGGQPYFFESMQEMPDLLPSSRKIHPDYVDEMEGIELGVVTPSVLARMVSEAASESPGDFEDLGSNPDLHRQVSVALATMCQHSDFKLNSVYEYRFIPCLQNGKISLRRPNHVGDLVWGVTSGFPVRNWTSHCHRDFIFGDSVERREELALHPIIRNQLTWLELHENHHEDLDDLCEKLRIHKAWPVTRGVNLIRSLIFAEDGNGLSDANPVSIFHIHEGGDWELERWLGRDLEPEELDEALSSVLSLLQHHEKGLSGGWGAHPREHLNSLYLLKDEDGDWSKVGDLCLELPQDLSELFGKRAISQEHQELLSLEMLTNEAPRDRNSGGGLGITQRIMEVDILDKLNSLDAIDSGTRSAILDMMLESTNPWSLERLDELAWVPRKDGEMTKPSNTMLPTDELVSMFGSNHPWFADAGADCNSPDVRNRASEIGIKVQHDDPEIILWALLGPDEIWSDLEGSTAIDSLMEAWKEDSDRSFDYTRRNRLPLPSGDWSDSSWICVTSETESLSELFPEKNVVDQEALGSKHAESMAMAWIMDPKSSGPDLYDILDRLEEEDDAETVTLLWSLVQPRATDESKDDSFVSRYSDLLVPVTGGTARIKDIVFYGPKSKDLVESEEVSLLNTLPGEHPLKETLTETFGAIDLDSVQFEQLEKILDDADSDNLSRSSLERLWLAIALLQLSDSELLEFECWPYKSSRGIGFTRAIPLDDNSKIALVPMRTDDADRVSRMISDGMPMFALPRSGPLMERIYERLESDKKGRVPFLNRCCIREDSRGTGGTPWQYMNTAIGNVLEAMGILGFGHVQVNSVSVTTTPETLLGRLIATRGFRQSHVFWKDDENPSNVSASVSDGELSITVSTARHNDRSDEELIHVMAKALRPDTGSRTRFSELIRRDEDNWSRIDERLNGISPTHPRPLIREAIYGEIRSKMHEYYGCCQICRRTTPANLSGGSQEGAIALFKKRGFYATDKIPYDLGNAMYLCPIHRDLHNRGLIRIPALDDAIDRIRGGESADEAVAEFLGGRGDIELTVLSYDRPPERAEVEWCEDTVLWTMDHATRFRSTLTLYLGSVI